MSLAFALTAAINGSTGSRATLSFGLKRTKPRRRLSGGRPRFSSFSGGDASLCPVNPRRQCPTVRECAATVPLTVAALADVARSAARTPGPGRVRPCPM
jgi:hypothetical protein